MGAGQRWAANSQVWETSESTPSRGEGAKVNTWLCTGVALSARIVAVMISRMNINPKTEHN